MAQGVCLAKCTRWKFKSCGSRWFSSAGNIIT